ncbi:hypothetical protein ARMGADRAFT_1092532 [Armillaria gallica]|uniref:RING-type domain-containing protein n=1 Tax=Armillaria gallica TaxID=47427 RepID=A0A2H3CAE1_ARMGA|nr:hypothetical protein ARMGADRAFT_1092532 [Armillaria gallica]
MAKSEALACAAHIQAQAERLWAALQPQWRTIEKELTCHVCCHKLWSAVRFPPNSLAPCGHIVCAGCAYQWFKSRHGKGALTCVSCNDVVTQRPLRAHLVEQAVSKLPTVNEEERTGREEADQKRGYLGDVSWNDFF